MLSRPLSPKATAELRALHRDTGYAEFPCFCWHHGPFVPHGVETGLCLKCFTPTGEAIVWEPDPVAARARSRRAGDREFNAICETCGPARHGVLMGKCLECFTPTGAPRKRRRRG